LIYQKAARQKFQAIYRSRYANVRFMIIMVSILLTTSN